MALVVADRVKETTTTTGTGAITLAGAETNFVTFSSVLSNADTTYYAIVDNTNSAFEVGLGTYASSGNTITRTTIISSSNSNNAVDLQAGSKDVFVTLPSNKFPLLDASGNVDINGGTIDGTTIGGSSAAAGTFTTANATTVDTTNIEVTNIKAKDGTSAGSIADSTGVVTIASSVLTTTDINGGTADGVTIGGSTAAAGTFTTFTSTGIDDNATSTAITIASGGDATFSGSVTVGDGTDTATHIAIKPADDTLADDLQFYNGTTRMGEIGTQDTTWLRINQETAKNIYTPRYIRSDGGFFVDGTSKGIDGSGNFIGGTVTTPALTTETASGAAIYIKDTSGTGATNHNSWISYRDSGGTEVGYVGYGSTSNTDLSVSNYSNGPVSLNGTAISLSADTTITGSVTTEGPDGGGIIRTWPGSSTYAMFGTANMSTSEYAVLSDGANTFIAGGAGGSTRIRYANNQTDKQIEVSSAGTTITGGAIDGATSDHFLLPNANNSESPNASTSRNGGAISYIYNRSSNVTLTRGDFAHHIIQQWSYGPTFTLTSSTFQRGDIVEFINVKGAVTITVVATIIYLPNGGNDTTLTLSQAGKFRLVRYSSNAGYWMVG